MDAKPRSWPQNIHLVARWLGTLDKKVERYSTGSHEDYRVFMSAEPAPSPESHIIPQGILENAIKITNEPPTGMYANLHKALDLFTQVRWLPLLCTPAPVPGLSSPGDPGRMEPLGLQSQGQTLSSEGAPRWLPPTQAPHARRRTRTHVSNRSRRAPGRPQVAVGAPVTHGCVKQTHARNPFGDLHVGTGKRGLLSCTRTFWVLHTLGPQIGVGSLCEEEILYSPITANQGPFVERVVPRMRNFCIWLS